MAIKILGIHSSPKDGATAAALRYALKCAEEIEGIETELVELRKGKLNPCLHCDACIKNNLYNCPVHNDAITPLYEKIIEADGIILASPVYQMAPNAQLAMLINRMRPLGKLTSVGGWGRKVGLSIAVGGTRNGGEETSLAVMNRYFLTQGMVLAGAGVYAYSGASIWGHNHHDDSVMTEDETNRMVIEVSARRMATMAKIIKTGIENLPDLLPCQIAGFRDEENRAAHVKAFFAK